MIINFCLKNLQKQKRKKIKKKKINNKLKKKKKKTIEKTIEEKKHESKIEDREQFLRKSAQAASIIERQMYDQLKEILGPDHVEYCPPSTPVDFLIRTESGRDIGVELKYTQTGLMPLRVANQLTSAAIELEMPVILLANASPSTTAKKRLLEFNKKHPKIQIKWLNIDESENLQRDIRNLFE